MSNLSRPLVVTVCVSLVLLGTIMLTMPSAGDGSSSPPASDELETSFTGPLVVELFTSQGCSSCPPADRLLSQLADDVEGEIIPLAYHVDYWNYIGWQDPFSSSAWSKRQQSYSRALGKSRIYTPQLVVGGAADCVGSDATEVHRLLAAAKQRGQQGTVEVDLQAMTDSSHLQAELAVRFEFPRPLDLMLAIVESGLVTEVKRGENARRTLHNNFVVRRLDKVVTLGDGETQWSSGPTVLNIDPEWSRDHLSVVAFLQDPVRLTIYGAGVGRI